MPKFKFEFKSSLKNTLEKLGLKDAFDPNRADFSNIAMDLDRDSEKIYLDDIVH